MKNYKYVLATAMTVAIISLTGCVAPGTPTAIDDTNMTILVKAALLNEAVYKVNQIHVDTINSVVTLSGTVQTRIEADRAVEMTKTIKGVKEIRDMLEVRP